MVLILCRNTTAVDGFKLIRPSLVICFVDVFDEVFRTGFTCCSMQQCGSVEWPIDSSHTKQPVVGRTTPPRRSLSALAGCTSSLRRLRRSNVLAAWACVALMKVMHTGVCTAASSSVVVWGGVWSSVEWMVQPLQTKQPVAARGNFSVASSQRTCCVHRLCVTKAVWQCCAAEQSAHLCHRTRCCS